ncbi:GPW/gp25 family protein [Billgrantia montanilacus]|uniref:Baseplate assembly protein n=1 Tax=Billgrantia montanilacus TaxID=2282305 RepID=A0A368U0Y2_9GAMM|nr:GPW/gp25 family protein [Halomonas montanilacus]RCV89722.1 baseplate assembly protein [Halomonas montanilacus]
MPGMNAHSGRSLDGLDHIRQSVSDILTTPIGTRVMRRDYGSMLFELIDTPLNDATLLQAYAAAVIALMRWEPRINVTAIRRQVSTTQPGRATLEIEGETRGGNGEAQPLQFEVPIT